MSELVTVVLRVPDGKSEGIDNATFPEFAEVLATYPGMMVSDDDLEQRLADDEEPTLNDEQRELIGTVHGSLKRLYDSFDTRVWEGSGEELTFSRVISAWETFEEETGTQQ